MNNTELANQLAFLVNDGQLKAAAEVLNEEIDIRDGLDFAPIVESYHKHLPMLPRICALTSARKRAMIGRRREHKKIENFWDEYFARVAASPFLTGKKTDWMASIDWLLTPRNMTKVLEGNYDPPRSSGGLSAGDEAAYRVSAANVR